MKQIWPISIDDIAPAEAYSLSSIEGKHLRVDMVSSIDGAFEIDGRSRALSSESDRRAFHAMRSLADVILVGAKTAMIENYKPVNFSDEVKAQRLERGQSQSAPIVLCSRSGNIDFDSPLFLEATEKTIIFTTEESASKIPDLKTAEVITCGKDDVDLVQAVDELTKRGLNKILCEGGPTLNASLLSAGLVDELCLSISPQIVQGTSPSIFNGPELDTPAKFKPTHIFIEDGFIFLRLCFNKG